MSFAAALAQRVSAKRQETKEREKEGQKWLEHETKLVEAAVELFKRRCVRAAENMQCQLSVSFEVLTREVPGFPTYTVKDGTYLVDNWGDAEPASWFYARRGASEPFTHGLPVGFAELLEGMMPQFLSKVKALGFKTCSRESCTWKVKVSWKTPQEAQLNGNATNGHAAEAEAEEVPEASPEASPSGSRPEAARPKQKARAEEKRTKAEDSESPKRSPQRSRSPPQKSTSPMRTRSKSKSNHSNTEVPSGTEVPTSDNEAK